MEILSIPWAQDIITAALELACDRCVMVFPTRAAAALARSGFQPRWNLEDITWTTMDEFKASLWNIDKPLLEDDKRLLALHQVLNPEDREYFHLLSFADVVDWGNHFFQFFEELGEAGHNPDFLETILQNGLLYLRYWQEEYLQKVASICTRYQDFITGLGFNDRIFVVAGSFSDVQLSHTRIVFVNQYYYSVLEKDLICKLEQQQNHVFVLYHGVEMSAANPWEPKELDLVFALQQLPFIPRIRLVECENDTQAALCFLNANLDNPPSSAAIVDASFHQKSYNAFFDPSHFRIPHHLALVSTRYYQYLSVLHKTVKEVHATGGYIPLSLIIQNFLDAELLQVLCPQWEAGDRACLRKELFKLSAEEVLYLDIQPHAQLGKLPFTLKLVEKLVTVIRQLSVLKSATELIRLMAPDQPLALEQICTEDELQYTDIQPKLWEAAANFSAAETLGVVQDWSAAFPDAELAVELLRLWLDFIKPIRLNRILSSPGQPDWDIINLLDSRNRKFDTLAFFNVVETVLPSSPTPVWLLNETQRGQIGLKTYKDIRSWERYYFFRLVLCARDVQIYTHRNPDKNIEPSSFIGELMTSCEQLGIPIEASIVHYKLPELFRVWHAVRESRCSLDLASSSLCCRGRTLPPEFFRLPANPIQDFFPDYAINCNSYSLSVFTRNPFVWYIQHLRQLSPLRAELVETISPTLFGTILHEYFARILRPHRGTHQGLHHLAGIFEDTVALRKSLEETISSPDFKYKIPKNYNAEFLNGIISDCLVETLQAFYAQFLLKRLADKSFELIPEELRSTAFEFTPRLLTSNEMDGIDYKLFIKGRADLRIETETKKLIIDFKTGGAAVEQLIFYEWFYYLIDHPDQATQLESLFWLIFDKTRGKDSTDAGKRDRYLATITASLNKCLQGGYTLGTRAEDRKWLKDITREDLHTAGAEDAEV